MPDIVEASSATPYPVAMVDAGIRDLAAKFISLLETDGSRTVSRGTAGSCSGPMSPTVRSRSCRSTARETGTARE